MFGENQQSPWKANFGISFVVTMHPVQQWGKGNALCLGLVNKRTDPCGKQLPLPMDTQHTKDVTNERMQIVWILCDGHRGRGETRLNSPSPAVLPAARHQGCDWSARLICKALLDRQRTAMSTTRRLVNGYRRGGNWQLNHAPLPRLSFNRQCNLINQQAGEK
uniref:SFRICE_005740 n=1 Tax=Spodoptera frugiperda TaxID=7108 RepID=A0A2H1VQ18_SPOFR